jgi:hypothetical protein
MPITSVGSYPATMQEFYAHWQQVDSFLGAKPIGLQGDYGFGEFTSDIDGVNSAIRDMIPLENDVQLSAKQRENIKARLRPRLKQFRALVIGLLPDSVYAAGLPLLPAFSADEGKFLRPFLDALNLWKRINADTTLSGSARPLVLGGSYTVAEFEADVVALQAAYVASNDARRAAQAGRDKRDVLLAPIKNRMKQYRSVVQGILPEGHPLLRSLPVLTPPLGSTPDPVAVTGHWDEAAQKAVLTWSKSTVGNLAHYSVRNAPGPVYKASEEIVIGTVPPSSLTFSTDLPGPYKVYVVTGTGNEKGSKAITVAQE